MISRIFITHKERIKLRNIKLMFNSLRLHLIQQSLTSEKTIVQILKNKINYTLKHLTVCKLLIALSWRLLSMSTQLCWVRLSSKTMKILHLWKLNTTLHFLKHNREIKSTLKLLKLSMKLKWLISRPNNRRRLLRKKLHGMRCWLTWRPAAMITFRNLKVCTTARSLSCKADRQKR
jgi:hypothetical protein